LKTPTSQSQISNEEMIT